MVDVTKKAVETADAEASVTVRRAGPLEFLQQVRKEMRKVTWPSWKETWLTTVMVFIMVGLTMVFFFGVDTVLAFGERLLIGAAG